MLYDMYNGAQYEDKEIDISQLSEARRGLFESAKACLELHSNDNTKSQQWLQSAGVALSCTVDLACPEVTVSYFRSSYLKCAEKACIDMWPEALPATFCDFNVVAKCYDSHNGSLDDVEMLLRKKLGRLTCSKSAGEAIETQALMQM
ncbi:hypothetical protein BGZ94_009293 [Podila epigama]|nr:hypothetical protein BGZ94_009293 [Podila epigama]